MEQDLKKKNLVFDVLDGRYGREGTTMNQLELKLFATKQPPTTFSASKLLWSFNMLVALAFGAFLLVYSQRVDAPLLEFIGLLCFFVIAVWLCVWLVKRTRNYKSFLASLKKPHSELVELVECLDEYLREFDKRTSRYFHCVTNTKVTAYYVLSQINGEIKRTIEKLDSLLAEPDYESTVEAAHILQGEILVSDGLVVEAG
ncbi:hypothetical protein OAO01_08200, partial [Oligoflexia bacterium]|nr:hypothetical protein [Oligoflexia bacterium]